MKLSDLRKKAASVIEEAVGEDKWNEASWIVSECTGLSGSFILSHPDTECEDGAAEKALSMAERRKMHEPIQYILGSAPFFGRDFTVNPSVLIPRADTEVLVEAGLDFIKNKNRPFVLDMCTGSGCIAVTVKAERPDAVVYAADISDLALNVAKINARQHETDVEFIKSDYFTHIPPVKFDIILSNPPYITGDEMKELPKDVADYEPELALFGGEDGLEAYRRIAADGKKFLKSEGALMLEIGFSQGNDVKKILADEGFHDVECIKDLGGRDRVICGIFN